MTESDEQAIAVVQAMAVVDDVDRNLQTLARLTGEAARRGARVVVTPELFATGYAPERAWRHDGAAVRRELAAIARAAGVTLVGSSVDSENRDGAHRIAASVFDAEGAETLRIHKRHLFGAVEQAWMTPAEGYGSPVRWSGASWGVGVCYDVEFPEFARTQARAGADILLIPTAVPTVDEGDRSLGDAWRYSSSLISTLQVPARALDNGVVIAYANHCGPGFSGASCIATPYGRLAALLGDEEGVAVARFPLSAVRAARRVNTYLIDIDRAASRRPEESP